MPTYATVDDVPDWDSLTDFDTLTVAEGKMVSGILRLVPRVAGDADVFLSVGADAIMTASVAGATDLRAA